MAHLFNQTFDIVLEYTCFCAIDPARRLDYVIMTNRLDGKRDSVSLADVKTCFDRIKGVDIITVDRNGLILSTLRKKI